MSEPVLDLEAICDQVVYLLVNTFDFPEAEARQRINLWKADQHRLEGEVLASLSPEERAQHLLRWVIEGDQVEKALRDGAKELGLTLESGDESHAS